MPVLLRSRLSAVCAALTICSAACANEVVAPDAGGEVVMPITNLSTGSSCPENSALGYENFGRAFFESYCLRCHTAAVAVSERLAPLGRDFDDLAMIRANAFYIDQFAAAGPKGEHMTMPPNGETPTLGQRTQLGEWLACGAPR